MPKIARRETYPEAVARLARGFQSLRWSVRPTPMGYRCERKLDGLTIDLHRRRAIVAGQVLDVDLRDVTNLDLTIAAEIAIRPQLG